MCARTSDSQVRLHPTREHSKGLRSDWVLDSTDCRMHIRHTRGRAAAHRPRARIPGRHHLHPASSWSWRGRDHSLRRPQRRASPPKPRVHAREGCRRAGPLSRSCRRTRSSCSPVASRPPPSGRRRRPAGCRARSRARGRGSRDLAHPRAPLPLEADSHSRLPARACRPDDLLDGSEDASRSAASAAVAGVEDAPRPAAARTALALIGLRARRTPLGQ
jgi:hypothetical protein